jgi:hypothetical protein
MYEKTSELIYEKLLEKVKSGNFYESQIIYNEAKNKNQALKIHDKLGSLFRLCCRDGLLNFAKWIWRLSEENNCFIDIHKNNEESFCSACIKNHINIVKWLWNLSCEINSPINIHILWENPFGVCCENGWVDIIEFLWDISIKTNSPINIHIDNDTPFLRACYKNKFSIAKWLWDLSIKINSPIQISILQKTFELIFLNQNIENIEIAKWLWEISEKKINIHNCSEKIFPICCQNGYYNSAKWIYDLLKENNQIINIDQKNLYAESGHLEILKLIINISKENNFDIDNYENINRSFRISCDKGHIQIAKFLHDEYIKINLWINIYRKEKFNNPFILSCKSSNLYLVKWIVEIYESLGWYSEIYNNLNSALIESCKKNNKI